MFIDSVAVAEILNFFFFFVARPLFECLYSTWRRRDPLFQYCGGYSKERGRESRLRQWSAYELMISGERRAEKKRSTRSKVQRKEKNGNHQRLIILYKKKKKKGKNGKKATAWLVQRVEPRAKHQTLVDTNRFVMQHSRVQLTTAYDEASKGIWFKNVTILTTRRATL